MRAFTVKNGLLGLTAILLAINLVVLTSRPAIALGKTEYKAVADAHPAGLNDAASVQRICDQMSSQGWEYVGSVGMVMIFKK